MYNQRKTDYMPIPIARRNLRWYEWYRLITVEPSITLYMMAFMTTTVVEQAFFVDKACRVNHGYDAEICNNLHDPKYKNASDVVQVTVSSFHQWNDIAGHVIPIILALFMGAWSDRRGRKLPLIMGLMGKLYYSILIVVNALQPTWPLEYVIYTATLPSTITGADVIIFATAFSYIADVSSVEDRTFRITMLDVCYMSTMPTGIALGRYLFSDVTNRSYSILFAINASLLALSIIYSFFVLEWRTTARQRPLSEAPNIFTDFFDRKHVVKTYDTITKRRPHHRRIYLIMFIFAMMFYTFQRDEKNYTYLFFQKVFHWTYDKYSNFRTFQSTLYVLALLFAVPVMNRVLGFRDTVIIMIGATSHAACRFIFIFAQVDWLFYLGAIISSFGAIVAPVLRSMTSKVVDVSERGCAFSLLSVADNAVPFISGTMYSQVYNATLTTYPQAFFWLTIATQGLVFVLLLGVHVTSTDATLTHTEIIEPDRTTITPQAVED